MSDENETLSCHHNPLARPLVNALREVVALRHELHELHDVQRDRDAYRAVAQQAIHALANLTTKHKHQSQRLHALLDEHRMQRRAA